MASMVPAQFKDLCLDASDVPQLAVFWSTVLGATVTDLGDGSARVDPRAGQAAHESIWINPVPEPRTAKTRVHLDLRLPDADPFPLTAAGATVVREPGEDPWWVLTDPEGNEFCAFPPREETGDRLGVFELVVDSRDPPAQAAWWASVVGGRTEAGNDGAYLVGADGFPWDYWVFQAVPEPKVAKNRLHWDVDLADDDPDDLVRLGATVLRKPGGDISWWVLADPEGNEFCAFPPRRGA
jgi:Glyoxalase-like domain